MRNVPRIFAISAIRDDVSFSMFQRLVPTTVGTAALRLHLTGTEFFSGVDSSGAEIWAREPLPLRIHNTMSLGYVRNSLSPQFPPMGLRSWKVENGVEFNALLDPCPLLLLQPVVQYYANVGGGTQRAVALGFRTKVEF